MLDGFVKIIGTAIGVGGLAFFTYIYSEILDFGWFLSLLFAVLSLAIVVFVVFKIIDCLSEITVSEEEKQVRQAFKEEVEREEQFNKIVKR